MSVNKPGVIIVEGHVQGLSLTRSLGEKGIPVIVVDKNNCIAKYSKYCKKFFICPDYTKPEFIDFLTELCKRENLHGWSVFPSNDHAVKNLSDNKDLLSNYYKIISDDKSIIDKIYSKKELLSVAESCNVPFPATYFPSDTSLENFNLQFPLLIKGIEGLTFYKTFSTKAFVVKSREELLKILGQIADKMDLNKVFIQEIIPAQEENFVCSFTAFSIKGEIKAHWTGEKVREHPHRFGTATFTKSIFDEKLLELGSKMIDKLQYTGTCEIEFLKDPRDNEYKLIEINARTWLWVGLAKACGIDYALYMYNYLNNIQTDYPKSYKLGVYWMNFWTDIPFSLIDITKGRYQFAKYWNSLKHKPIQAVYSKNDMLPFLMMTLLLPYLTLKRL